MPNKSNTDLNNLKTNGVYQTYSCTNAPAAYGMTQVFYKQGDIRQVFMQVYHSDISIGISPITYVRNFANNAWSDWAEVAINVPSFYKNYADLNALTNALVKQNALSIGNVVVITNADSYTRFFPADRALESGIASIAVGAGIIENGRTLIIAKDAANKQWATSNATGGTTAITDKRAAVADFDGRAKTTTILATLGDNAPAAKYCNEYYPSNVASSDSNMGAGRWWLPSLGEWAMIWAHVREVNFVLAAIGGTQIPVGSGWTWSSTEYSATFAWYLSFSSGGFNTDDAKTLSLSVRPVSAFY